MADISFELRKAYKAAISGAGVSVYDQISNGDDISYAIIGTQTETQISNKARYFIRCTVQVTAYFRQSISASRENAEEITNDIISAIRGNELTLSGYLMHSSVLTSTQSGSFTTGERVYSTKTLTFTHDIEQQ